MNQPVSVGLVSESAVVLAKRLAVFVVLSNSKDLTGLKDKKAHC